MTQSPTNNLQSNVLNGATAMGAIGGSVASLVTQQLALATIPLSFSIVLQIFNNRKLMSQLNAQQSTLAEVLPIKQQIQDIEGVNAQQQEQLNQLPLLTEQATQLQNSIEGHEASLQELPNDIAELNQQVSTLSNDKTLLQQEKESLKAEQVRIQEKLQLIQDIQSLSRTISEHPKSAKSIFLRGTSYEKIGDYTQAIEDYTATLRLDATNAAAYHHRGKLYKEIGQGKAAIDDLRQAAQLYFTQGDIENYELSKQLTNTIHQSSSLEDNQSETKGNDQSDTTLIGNLFA
ncbi:tetratricopeptide repeat protein [Acaryochloris sp. IP29b_bin.137]|uniref:tetratricopeptide repeat protein n=1 Tax=Acaryochloris sp. IP29b_bin.137 TaxID=2969217 RepID=UPI002611A26E|nr:tetratricopeptide repeat protein [Acaryochloris sp. IP29b_bin.137]